MNARALGALVLLAAIWGASFLFIRVAAPVLGPFPLMAGRVLIAAIALGAIAAARRAPVTLRPFAPRLLVLGLVHAAVPFALIAAAELRVTASMAALLIATQPLFAALIGSVWFGEPIAGRRAVGLALGLVGVALVTGWSPVGGGAPVTLAVAATLLAALCYAAGGIYAKRRMADAPVWTLALGQQVAALAWLALPALWALPRATITRDALLALLGLALLSTAIAYLLFFRLIADVGPVKAFTVTYLIPVFGVVWGAVVLGEQLTPAMIAGLACILPGMVLVNTSPDPASPRASAARYDVAGLRARTNALTIRPSTCGAISSASKPASARNTRASLAE